MPFLTRNGTLVLASLLEGLLCMDEIHFAPLQNHGKPLLVCICRGIMIRECFFGGAKWVLSASSCGSKAPGASLTKVMATTVWLSPFLWRENFLLMCGSIGAPEELGPPDRCNLSHPFFGWEGSLKIDYSNKLVPLLTNLSGGPREGCTRQQNVQGPQFV